MIIKIYLKCKKTITVECENTYLKLLLNELNSEKKFISISNIVINKKEIKYATTKQT